MLVKRGKKSLKFGNDGLCVTVSFSIAEMLKDIGINAPTARYVHRMSTRKARLYADRLLRHAASIRPVSP